MKIVVMSRAQTKKYSYKKHNENAAVLSISDKVNPRLTMSNTVISHIPENGITRICRFFFDDVEENDSEGYCITDEDARFIVNFVQRVRNEVDLLIVHCEAGVSRSAGVAAAIMKSLYNDDTSIFENPKFRPNMTCYRKVLTAFSKSENECVRSKERK